jgi:hypothetical protein
METQTPVFIRARYNGPPESGNGGYSCGLLAQFVPGTAEVTLKKPPPLERPLCVAHGADGRVQLLDGDVVIAEARPAALDLAVPSAPAAAEVARATAKYVGHRFHAYPRCFVCGPARAAHDGLRIFAGPTDTAGLVAAPWTPDATLGDARGLVRPEFLWSALDCPGYFADVEGDQMYIALLGRLTASRLKNVRVGEPCTVLGWRLGREGRKHFVGSAVIDAAGQVCAKGRGVWIDLQ